jgi:hypothetical protein
MIPRQSWRTGCIILAAGAMAAAAELSVWTEGATQRVLRAAPPGPQREVRLAAARGEWEGFQVLVRAPAAVPGLTLAVSDFQGPGQAVIPAAGVQCYREQQFEITKPSFRNDQFVAGWYPDGLIPFRHPLTGAALPPEARLRAVPFDLPAAETHGFFVDVPVPQDAAAGEYTATVTVSAADGSRVSVPVRLTVWDFALPAVASYQTEFGWPGAALRGYYAKREKEGKEKAPADWQAVDRQCADLLAQHRFNVPLFEVLAPQRQENGSFAFPEGTAARVREHIDRYRLNALPVPHPVQVVQDPVAEGEVLRAWFAAWDRLIEEVQRPGVTFFIYLRDEPNDAEEYRYVQTWGRAVRALSSRVKILVVEQTAVQDAAWGDLYGAVDIWCALFPLFDEVTAAKRQALGETIWTYTALAQCNPPSPWWATDQPLLNYRVPAWISWRYDIRGLLYWGSLAYWNEVDDPWSQSLTLDRSKQNPATIYHGEGSLVYPGRAAGYDGIAPSLRLKALRDGSEDYELLAMLRRAGQGEEAMKSVQLVARSWFDWDKDPEAYQRVRRQLADLILKTHAGAAAP